MKLFDGMGKTDYQDVLRAVGRLVDEYGYRDIRMFETEDGLILQGRRLTGKIDAPAGAYETTFFTDQDVETILSESYRLRKPSASGKLADATPATTTTLLRKLKTRRDG